MNFARVFNFRQDLTNVLDQAHKQADLYWFFSVTTDVDGEVTFEGVANNYYQLTELLGDYIDDELVDDIVNRFAISDVIVSAQYEPTTLIDYSETNNSLEVTYCIVINIEEQ